MKVTAVTAHEYAVLRFERRAVGFENMARDTVQIEIADEQIVLEIVPEHFGFVRNHTVGCRRAEVNHHWHQFTGFFERIKHVWMRLAINAAVNGMYYAVTTTRNVRFEKRDRQKA